MNTCIYCGLPILYGLSHATLKDCIQELQRRVSDLEREEMRLEAKRRELEAKQKHNKWLVHGGWDEPEPPLSHFDGE